MSCENGSTVSARKKRSRTLLIASTWTPRLLRLICRQVVQIVALMLDQRSKANSIASWLRRRLRRGVSALPAVSETVASYIAAEAQIAKPSTIGREEDRVETAAQ